MTDIVIYPDKRYLLALAAGCLLLTGGSIYLIIYGYDVSGRDSVGQFFKAITPGIFYIGVPMFSLLLIYICYRLLHPMPSVIINQEGIFDNASLFGAGMLRWEEIENMFVYQIMDSKFLGLVPADPETVIARQPAIKRFFFKMGKGMSPAPFAIPEDGLPMPAEELLAKAQLYRISLSRGGA